MAVQSSFCTVFCLYCRQSVQFCYLLRRPFLTVCPLCSLPFVSLKSFRWMPVQLSACTFSAVNHVYNDPFVKSSVCIVVSLYGRQSARSSVCTGVSLYWRQSVRAAVCTGGSLYGRQCVRASVCSVVCLYGRLSVRSLVCTVVSLYSWQSVQYRYIFSIAFPDSAG